MPRTPAEISDFAFCAYSWELRRRRKGYEGSALHRGRRYHEMMGHAAQEQFRALKAAAWSLFVALAFFFVNITLYLLAELDFLETLQWGRALSWLSVPAGLAAFWFGFRACRQFQESQTVTGRQRFAPGVIVYSDFSLLDDEWDLVGKPDYVMWGTAGLIPVDLKNRDSPAVLFESHRLQMIAYCRLVEKAYGSRPPYALVQYLDDLKEVTYDADAESSLRVHLDRMNVAEAATRVERDHESAAKCAGCSHRNYCDLALVARG